MNRRALGGCVVVYAVCASLAPGATIFVDASLAGGANNGSSWQDAFRGRLGLAAALAAAQSGDEIWVADGVYAPAPANGDRLASFVMRSGVAVLGGFAGGETSAAQRNPALHVATLTGDLNGNDGPPNNGITPNSGENSRHVVRFEGVVGARLDGVTIRAGLADGQGDRLNACGGNIRVVGGEALIEGCVLENGRCTWTGASLAIADADATVRRCVIRRNRSDARGSGIAVLTEGVALIEECEFVENVAGQGGGMFVGTTMFNDTTSTPGAATVVRSRFADVLGFLSSPSGGGIMVDQGSLLATDCEFINNGVVGGGGALYIRGGSSWIDRCEFVGNSAPGDGGGAIYVDGRPGPQTEPALITNSRFVGNNGAVAVNFNGAARLVNCTIANNSFGFGFLTWPAAFVSAGSSIVIENSIIWGNNVVDLLGPDGSNFIGSGSFALANTIVDGVLAVSGPGVVDADPAFVDLDGADGVRGTLDDDLRLRPGSPAIDAGDTGALPIEAVLDLLGGARRIDADQDGTAAVDLGALEARCPGDATGDGVVDFADLNVTLALFGAGAGSGADMNFDGVVDFADLNAALSAFGADCR